MTSAVIAAEQEHLVPGYIGLAVLGLLAAAPFTNSQNS